MDTAEYRGGMQQGSSSCLAAGAEAACGASLLLEQQQKRQRCQGLSSDQVGSSTSDSMEMCEPELQDFDYEENEEEDYYTEDDKADDEYEFNEAEFNDFNQQLADKFDDLDLPPGVEATVPWMQKIAEEEQDGAISKLKTEDENSKKYKSFKQFDTVQNFSDHYYSTKSLGKTSREWAKRIQHDWKLLEKDLPGFIHVRVAEDRMDLLRALIIGPKGTPYHDGLFFFDVHFPSNYPTVPPLVHYHSGGLRINPNLYNCGKVCLSLLGTWTGTNACEKWNSAESTMLQVLVSIQALILNEKPYFNEPGYEVYANRESGQRTALEYNDTVFLHSCRTMLYSLRRPPEHFAYLVAGHFQEHGRTILAACKHYMEGSEVGSVVSDEEEPRGSEAGPSSSSNPPKQQPNKMAPVRRRHSSTFKSNLQTLFEELLMEFNVKGADTKRFLEEKVKKNLPAA